ncbi:MAG: hypothetical protein WCG84_01110 [Candidatus Moraniibacteriota bacterium]
MNAEKRGGSIIPWVIGILLILFFVVYSTPQEEGLGSWFKNSYEFIGLPQEMDQIAPAPVQQQPETIPFHRNIKNPLEEEAQLA